MGDTRINDDFRLGRFSEARARLETGLKKVGEGRDQLLYLLDLGLVSHTEGDWEASNRYFLEAEKIAEIKDYTNFGEETATLFTSDNVKQYKGEDFEKVLINVYLSINYTLLGKMEDAIVEARKVNRILVRMIDEGKKPYKQNAFARYLSAMLYEADKQWDHAYIDYKKAFELEPGVDFIKWDLWRLAFLTKNPEDMRKWRETFAFTEEDFERAKGPLNPKWGEVIVLYQNGIGPIKRPNPNYQSVPKFYARYNPVSSAEVLLDGEPVLTGGETRVLYNIESTAIKNLDDKYAGIIAKKIGGAIAKGAVGVGVAQATKNSDLGLLAALLLFASDQADLRSWVLVPKDLQVARFMVPPGEHEVQLKLHGSEKTLTQKVKVEKGKKKFLNFRFLP